MDSQQFEVDLRNVELESLQGCGSNHDVKAATFVFENISSSPSERFFPTSLVNKRVTVKGQMSGPFVKVDAAKERHIFNISLREHDVQKLEFSSAVGVYDKAECDLHEHGTEFLAVNTYTDGKSAICLTVGSGGGNLKSEELLPLLAHYTVDMQAYDKFLKELTANHFQLVMYALVYHDGEMHDCNPLVRDLTESDIMNSKIFSSISTDPNGESPGVGSSAFDSTSLAVGVACAAIVALSAGAVVWYRRRAGRNSQNAEVEKEPRVLTSTMKQDSLQST